MKKVVLLQDKEHIKTEVVTFNALARSDSLNIDDFFLLVDPEENP